MRLKTYHDSGGTVRLRVATIWLRLRCLPILLRTHYLLARRYTHRRRATWIAIAFGWAYMLGH